MLYVLLVSAKSSFYHSQKHIRHTMSSDIILISILLLGVVILNKEYIASEIFDKGKGDE